MRIPGIMPDIWNILHKENQQQIQVVKEVKQTKFKYDRRKSRWNFFHFNRIWSRIKKGWWYYLGKL